MYHVYSTQGIVLGRVISGEANSFLWIFTRDLGLVGATAQGVRLNKSKLRYGLQMYSHSEVSLVRGKGGWRVVSARPMVNVYQELREKGAASLSLFLNVMTLLRRMVQGQESDEELYNVLMYMIEFLRSTPAKEISKRHEELFVYAILTLLGYVPHDEEFTKRLYALEKGSTLVFTDIERKEMIQAINQGLRSAHL